MSVIFDLMEDLNTIHEIYKVEPYLSGEFSVTKSVVLDLGSSDGRFADYCESLGAKVYRVDIRGGAKTLPVAVGNSVGCFTADGDSTGTHILYKKGNTPTVRLSDLLAFIGQVDVIKCDIEGSEYEIFEGVDLSKVKYLAIEYHAWTEPGQESVARLGERTGPMPKDALNKLIRWLSKTHTVQVVGDHSGGYLYCR